MYIHCTCTYMYMFNTISLNACCLYVRIFLLTCILCATSNLIESVGAEGSVCVQLYIQTCNSAPWQLKHADGMCHLRFYRAADDQYSPGYRISFLVELVCKA